MSQIRPELPGVPRSAAWVPSHDPTRNRGVDPGTLYSAGRPWTAFGLGALDHTLSVNVTTGGVTLAATDLSMPYHSGQLRILRTLDVQEQYAQATYLDMHPNTDPRFHLFGNWQFQREPSISLTWDQTHSELLVTYGMGGSALFYREVPNFGVNTGSSVEARLRSYGIPGQMLMALGWQYAPYDSILRTRQGSFAILSGAFEPATMVDPANVLLWIFDPVSGMGYKYTSQYAYQQFMDTDGLRESTVQALQSEVVDALGHAVSFQPVATSPPYRAYRLTDGSGRSFRVDLNQFVTYLDGDRPGGKVKTYLISRAVDETQPDKNLTEYIYESGRLTQVSFPAQDGGAARLVKYDYDDRGNLVRMSDPVGDAYTIEYKEDLLDSDQRLIPRLKVTRISDSEGNSAAYHYDHPNKRVVVTMSGADQHPHAMTYTYVEDDKDTDQRYITSETIEVTSGYSGNQTVQSTWHYTDDGRFLVDQVLDPLGNAFVTEYNAFNQVNAQVEPTGHRREFHYDLKTAPSAEQPNRYDLLQTSEMNIDINGVNTLVQTSQTYGNYDVATSLDPADVSHSTHRVAAQTDELGNVTHYGYDDPSNFNPLMPTAMTDPLGKVTSRAYDATGQLLRETDAESNTLKWSYNTRGQMITFTDANNFRHYWAYDTGTTWLIDQTDALGIGPGDAAHSIHYDWNDAGQCIRQKDAIGAIREYTYFSNKRLRTITGYDPAARQILFAYNVSGALTKMTDARSHATNFLYDEAGRLYETFRNTPGNPAIRFLRDVAGRVTSVIDRNGQVIRYTRDVLGRVVALQEPNWPAGAPVKPGKVVTFKYDNLSRLLLTTDSQLPGNYVRTYDAAGNLTVQRDHFGLGLKRSYDARNTLIRLYDDTGGIDVHFDRDNAGRLATIVDSGYLDSSRTFHYSWTDGLQIDNLYQIKADGGITSRFQYDPNRRLTSVQHELAGTALATFGYDYRADGRIGQATGDHSAIYEYDGLQQLVHETDAGVRDSYDAAGNRLWRAANVVAPGRQAVYDAENRLLNTPLDGMSFQYDANGNMLLRQSSASGKVEYMYDGANRLMNVSHGLESTAYLYDFDGRLIQRSSSVGGKTSVNRYQYADAMLLAEFDDQNKRRAVYTRDDTGRLLRMRTTDKLYPLPTHDKHSIFYLHDGLGSVCQEVDSDGNPRARIDYDAWGGCALPKQASEAHFRYRQGYLDDITGFVNFGVRWYDPTLGRWISQDPLITRLLAANADTAPSVSDLLNLYMYVANDPLNATDLTGLDPEGFKNTKIAKALKKLIEGTERGLDWNPTIPDSGKTQIEQAKQKVEKANRPQESSEPEKEKSKFVVTPEQALKFVGILLTIAAAVGVAAVGLRSAPAGGALIGQPEKM